MTTLDMAIGSSPRLAMLLLLSHSITAIVAYATAMPVVAKTAVFMLILLSLGYHLTRDFLRLLPDSWVGIALGCDGVSIGTRDGGNFTGRVGKKTVVCSYLVVLRIMPEGYRFPVARVIFPDALDGEEFRELCVRLKFA